MLHQLLWIEIVSKGAVGLLLLLAPRTLARLLGLPPAAEPFWPRCVGGVLVGLAAAAFLEVTLKGANGLGVAGAIAVNLSVAGAIGGQLIMGQPTPAHRGRVLLWLAAGALMLLALAEIPWA